MMIAIEVSKKFQIQNMNYSNRNNVIEITIIPHIDNK